jgi:N-acetylglucosaminyldiphosphoundecaprenol N-acetyl-beta-D-mannosaminyltransferase
VTPNLGPRSVVILGVPFHDLIMEEAVAEIVRLVDARRPRYVATANLDFAARASEDVELQRILLEAELVLCDGQPLVWASRRAGTPLRERVAGSDLVPRLAEEAANRNWSLYFLGGEPDSLAAALDRLRTRHPTLRVDGYAPPFRPLLEMDHDDLAARIRTARPDLLFVAFGCPKQEKWIYMHYQRLGVPVSIGVGATVDFLAGRYRRAPRWAQAIGAEWVVRLMQEPRRLFHRYWFDLLFFIRATRAERQARRRPGPDAVAPAPLPTPLVSPVRIVAWPAEVTASSLLNGLVPSVVAEPGRVLVLDLSAVRFLDSSGLGALVRGYRQHAQSGGALVLLRPSAPVRQLLRTVRLDRLLPSVEDANDAIRAAGLRPPSDGLAPGPGEVVLALTGDLTASAARGLGVWIEENWALQRGATRLRLDLRAVNFIDSSGLGLLLRARRLVSERPGAQLVLTGANANVRNVVALAKLGAVLPLEDAPA